MGQGRASGEAGTWVDGSRARFPGTGTHLACPSACAAHPGGPAAAPPGAGLFTDTLTDRWIFLAPHSLNTKLVALATTLIPTLALTLHSLT